MVTEELGDKATGIPEPGRVRPSPKHPCQLILVLVAKRILLVQVLVQQLESLQRFLYSFVPISLRTHEVKKNIICIRKSWSFFFFPKSKIMP